GDAGTGDHGLGGRAAHIDTRAADVLPFDDRGAAAGAAQIQSQRFARLAGAQDDCVKTLRLHESASTIEKSSAVAALSADGNLFLFYELIAGDEARWQTACQELCRPASTRRALAGQRTLAYNFGRTSRRRFQSIEQEIGRWKGVHVARLLSV